MDGLLLTFAFLLCVFVLALGGLIVGLVRLIRVTKSSQNDRPLSNGCTLVILGASISAILMVTSVFQPFVSPQKDISIRYPSPTGLPPVLYYDTSDAVVRPFIQAIDAIDREALGFTPIAPHTRISLSWIVGKEAAYDVEMHVYGATDRYVAFQKHDTVYTWVAEQEIHFSPNSIQTSVGETPETISITYETVYFSGASPYTISINYSGNDPRLAKKSYLTLSDVQPILQEWNRVSPTPTQSE